MGGLNLSLGCKQGRCNPQLNAYCLSTAWNERLSIDSEDQKKQ